MSSVSSVPVVNTLACILLGTLPACDEVDTILRFAGEVVSDPVGFSSIAAHVGDTCNCFAIGRQLWARRISAWKILKVLIKDKS